MRTPLQAHSYQFTGTPRYASLKTDTPGLTELRWGGMSQWPLRTFLCPELKQLISQFQNLPSCLERPWTKESIYRTEI